MESTANLFDAIWEEFSEQFETENILPNPFTIKENKLFAGDILVCKTDEIVDASIQLIPPLAVEWCTEEYIYTVGFSWKYNDPEPKICEITKQKHKEYLFPL